MSLRIRTNAKLNLYLRVGARRADGFHDLETVFHSVSLADELEFERLDGPGVQITVSGGAIDATDNLVVRAAKLLQERTTLSNGVAVDLRKHIPIGGGLAGGSGNAAGALIGLNELWNLKLRDDELMELALQLGSDVPYCLRGGTCIARGRGEVLMPLPEPEPMWFVLGISDASLSTAAVYAAYRQGPEGPPVEEVTAALRSRELEALGGALHNDLEAAAISLVPGLLEKKASLREAGALGALVSGSGPTVFGLCRDEGHAREVAGGVAKVFDRVEVAASRPAIVEQG